MPKSKTPHRDRLAELREAELKERTAARDLEAKKAAARTAADEAHRAHVQAHVDGTDAKRAAKQRIEAEAEADDLAVQVQAAAIRVQRAKAEADQYHAAHGEQLIAERRPRADASADRCNRAVAEVIAAFKERSGIEDEDNADLAATPGASSRTDGAPEHHYTEPVRGLRKAAAIGPVPPPVPSWRGVKAQADQQAANRALAESRAA